MKKDPKILITHILQSIKSVEKYSKGLEKERFMNDEEKQKTNKKIWDALCGTLFS